MKTTIMAILVLGMSAASALAWENPYERRSGRSYDYQSGNSYNWNTDYSGNTRVRGTNYRTGSMWNTTVERDGDMRGTDSDGNSWNYNSRTNTYMNYGTGTYCTGSGAYRFCN
jgi:hypothetical protein